MGFLATNSIIFSVLMCYSIYEKCLLNICSYSDGVGYKFNKDIITSRVNNREYNNNNNVSSQYKL